MDKVVKLSNVKKTYQMGKTEVKALGGISLEIDRGAFMCICGPSGSGKTTLLNHIGCLDKPTSGKIKVLELNVLELSDSKLSELRNKHIGFIFQSFNLIPVLSAYENVEYPLLIRGVKKSKRKEQCLKILEEVGLLDYKDHTPDELSGGQQERVSIARALVGHPEIVLADEPTSNLDTETGEKILETMRELNENHSTTFIFSTHDHQTLDYAKTIYNLRDGRMKLQKDV